MSAHVLDWLPAYHDGELSPSRRRRVEDHLQECGACRDELRALQALAALLEADAVPALTSAQRFASRVQLQLPRTPVKHSSAAGTTRLPRWLLAAPLLLILAGAFLQAGLWLTNVLLSATAFLGPTAAPFTAWFGAGGLLRNDEVLFVLNTGLLAIGAVLWGAWMALWWSWTRTRNHPLQFERLEKEV